MKEKTKQVRELMPLLKQFMPVGEIQAIEFGLLGEEYGYFLDKVIEMGERIQTMPKTMEQDGLGDEAIVHLHYFLGGHDFYITEKDCVEGEPQHQAFGYACLDWGYPELGYISIQELIDNNIELDLHWTPKPLRLVKLAREVAS